MRVDSYSLAAFFGERRRGSFPRLQLCLCIQQTKRAGQGELPEQRRQKVLLTGMDCQPGQRDLFGKDGEAA